MCSVEWSITIGYLIVNKLISTKTNPQQVPFHFDSIQDEQTRFTRPVKPRITASDDAQMDSKYRSFFERIAGQVGNKPGYFTFDKHENVI